MKKRKEFKLKPRILKVIHQPTYTVLTDEWLEGRPARGTPAAFKSKREIQTQKSMTRLKNSISWMLLFADKKRVYSKKEKKTFSFRLAFITLTLSGKQDHTDAFIKEHMLQPFLYWLDRYYHCSYVWKAESQLNGNIHFHITVDTFIPWQSVRAKWNKLLSKYQYCKVFQDGTNDRGNSATQIKSVLNELQCARDIGGYMSKKDEVTKTDQNELEQGNYLDYEVHCKFDPELETKKQNKRWYKRVIEGRLWGCSANLSKIQISLDEQDFNFRQEETIFFQGNSGIENIGKKVIAREKEKHSKKSDTERALLKQTDEDIEKRYAFLNYVYMHRNLKTMKTGPLLNSRIADEKKKRKRVDQKFFTTETFYDTQPKLN